LKKIFLRVATSPAEWLFGLALLLVSCTATTENGGSAGLEDLNTTGPEVDSTAEAYSELQIITVLPRDAISAIDDPQFIAAEEADKSYNDEEMILGVEFNGDARAYSIPLLSSHEIVNDTVGGVAISVTW
jgi:hypothetical protein